MCTLGIYPGPLLGDKYIYSVFLPLLGENSETDPDPTGSFYRQLSLGMEDLFLFVNVSGLSS